MSEPKCKRCWGDGYPVCACDGDGIRTSQPLASEQDKEMEAAAEKYAVETQEHLRKHLGYDVVPAWGPLAGAYQAGWKAASERKDAECEAGCQIFDGGEKRHHKDCVFYPESFTKMYDDLQSKLATAEALIAKIEDLERSSIGSEHFGDRVYYTMCRYREGK